jgi:hypothetical protein
MSTITSKVINKYAEEYTQKGVSWVVEQSLNTNSFGSIPIVGFGFIIKRKYQTNPICSK